MSRLVSTVVLVMACAAPAAARAEAPLSAIDTGFDRLHDGDRGGACEHFERLVAIDPHDLAATHGLLWALQARTRWEPQLIAVYEQRLDRFIAEAEARHDRSASDVGVRFYLGQGYMLRARFRLEQDKGVWSAARDAARARSHIEAYLQHYPEHGDAYLTLGLYNYYVDIAPTFVKFVRTLLFLPSGSREQGLAQLHRAATTGHWLAAAAREALVEIYGRYEQRPDLARATAEPLLAQHRDNLDFRFALADTLAHPAIEQYDRAADEYAAILARARDAGSRQPATLTARARLGLAAALLHAWRLDEAVATVSTLVDAKDPKPAWALPQALLLRSLCRGLRGQPDADADLQTILDTPALQPWHAAARAQRERLARHNASGEAAILVELIPGNRAVTERRWDDARAAFAAAAERHPRNRQVEYRAARLTFAEGHLDEARARFAAIVDARTDSASDWIRIEAMLFLARTYDLLGRRADAIPLYKAVVSASRGGDAQVAARTGLLTPYRSSSS